jgi:haloacid dehalogenase-like hydrolase
MWVTGLRKLRPSLPMVYASLPFAEGCGERSGAALKPEFVNGGLCATTDPPRPDCVDAIAEARKASVRVAMITGDHKDTAPAIGTQLGLVDKKYPEAITGQGLDAMADDEIRCAVKKYNVFAPASPQNKIQIIKALQAQGVVCSMTGDGVVSNFQAKQAESMRYLRSLVNSLTPILITRTTPLLERLLTWALPWAKKERMWLARLQK